MRAFRVAIACVAALGLAYLVFAEHPARLREGGSAFEIPAAYAPDFSFMSLWFLSGGDGSSRSAILRLPAGLVDAAPVGGMFHLANQVELNRIESANDQVAHEISERTGEFAGGNLVDDGSLGGARALPDNFASFGYWYLIQQQPTGRFSADDVVARCYGHRAAPSSKGSRCYMTVVGRGYYVQYRIYEKEMKNWRRIAESTRTLVETWRVAK